MFAAYLIFTSAAIGANAFSAVCDFVKYEPILIVMRKAGVPVSWLTTLGVLKGAAAIGLFLGFWFPVLGSAAAIGIMMFFVCAIVIHLRVNDYSFGLAVTFLLLALGSFVCELRVRGASAWTFGI